MRKSLKEALFCISFKIIITVSLFSWFHAVHFGLILRVGRLLIITLLHYITYMHTHLHRRGRGEKDTHRWVWGQKQK